METWDDLKFWQSGEWQVIQEKLDDFDLKKIGYNPRRENIFAALDEVDLKDVKVAFFGQDPYPTALSKHATGMAFDIPRDIKPISFPPTLRAIFTEYVDDLHYDYPKTGSLIKWTAEGVLLWNVVPTCFWGKSLSNDWTEWFYLTKEMIEKLNEKGIVFVLFGSKARSFLKYIDQENCKVIEVTHPSPRVMRNNFKHPFVGSRIFSRVNALLVEEGKETIDWRL